MIPIGCLSAIPQLSLHLAFLTSWTTCSGSRRCAMTSWASVSVTWRPATLSWPSLRPTSNQVGLNRAPLSWSYFIIHSSCGWFTWYLYMFIPLWNNIVFSPELIEINWANTVVYLHYLIYCIIISEWMHHNTTLYGLNYWTLVYKDSYWFINDECLFTFAGIQALIK